MKKQLTDGSAFLEIITVQINTNTSLSINLAVLVQVKNQRRASANFISRRPPALIPPYTTELVAVFFGSDSFLDAGAGDHGL